MPIDPEDQRAIVIIIDFFDKQINVFLALILTEALYDFANLIV